MWEKINKNIVYVLIKNFKLLSTEKKFGVLFKLGFYGCKLV